MLGGQKRDNPVPAVVMSIAFHVLLVAVAWWFSRDTGPRIDLNAKPITAKLVRLGEQRDQKLLPRMQPNAPPPEPEAVAVPSKPSPSQPLQPKPKPKPAPKHDLTKDLFAQFDKTKPVTKPDKLAGAADGDVNGDSDTADESERYFGILSSRIKRNYDVSSAIADAERVRLQATIIIYVDAQGDVIKTEWQQKSGNALFDSAVASAVQKAGPFPPPPQFLADDLRKAGVALKFRP